MTSSKKILVVGLGFGQLYVDLLRSKGHEVYTLDLDPDKNPTFRTIDQAIEILNEWFLTIICTPNYTHAAYVGRVGDYCANILVEKPGFKDIREHVLLTERFPNLHMTKNNFFREEFLIMKKLVDDYKLIDIRWCEKNRIPSPGSWFTTKEKAFGGVSRDLLPHLFHMLRLFLPEDKIFIENKRINQNFTLDEYITTEYGTIHRNGTYDVDDYVWLDGRIGKREFILHSFWKQPGAFNSDHSGKYIQFNSGKIYDFELCPVSAYDRMLDKLFFNPDPELQKISRKLDMELMTIYEYLF